MSEKDGWDRFEIVARAIGVLVIPVALAGAAYYLNEKSSHLQAADARIRLALEILDRPGQSSSQYENLREWARQTISNPEVLTELPSAGDFAIQPSSTMFSGLSARGAAVCDQLRVSAPLHAASLLNLNDSAESVAAQKSGLEVLTILDVLCKDYGDQSFSGDVGLD